MNGQQATQQVVITQNEQAENAVQQTQNSTENASGSVLSKRHFLVPEYKVSVVKRNRSFELGYN